MELDTNTMLYITAGILFIVALGFYRKAWKEGQEDLRKDQAAKPGNE